MKLRLFLLFSTLPLVALSAAHADTVFTSVAAFSAATLNPTTTTFGTTAYTNQFTPVAGPGSTYTVGPVSITPSNAYLNLTNANYYNINGGLQTYPDGNFLAVSGGTTGVNDLVTIAFPSSTAFSIALGGDFASGETFTYTLSDGFTGTYTSTGYVTSGSSLGFLGFTSSAPISSITLSSAESGNPASYDNIVYATATTPEPSSLYLLGTGLLGGLATIRRRIQFASSK